MPLDNLGFQALQGSLDALWLKQKVITHNLANVETPGFKAKEVSFENVLADAERENAKNVPYQFRAVVTSDETTSTRPDGNNVDVDKENLELFDTYLQAVAIYQKMNSQISDVRYVLSQAFR